MRAPTAAFLLFLPCALAAVGGCPGGGKDAGGAGDAGAGVGGGAGSDGGSSAGGASSPVPDLLAQARERGTLRVASEFGAPPMLYIDEKGQGAGFDLQVIHGIASRMGLQPELVGVAWRDQPVALQQGKADVVVSGWIPNTGVEAAFSEAYLESGLCLVVKVGSPVRDLSDLGGRKVGLYPDPAARIWAQKNLPPSTVVELEDGYFEMLAGEQIDAFIYDYPFVIGEIAPFVDKLRIVRLNLYPFRYSVMLPRKQDALLAAVNAAVAELRASDEYGRAMRDSFGFPWTAQVLDLSFQERTAGSRLHQVKKGETLRDLARQYYGDPERWVDVWRANREFVAFPELVVPGSRVVIP
jgi:ABC-type amino acid transport substrate-binding protein